MVDLIGGRPQGNQSGFINTQPVITTVCLPEDSAHCELCQSGQRKQAKTGCADGIDGDVSAEWGGGSGGGGSS